MKGYRIIYGSAQFAHNEEHENQSFDLNTLKEEI